MSENSSRAAEHLNPDDDGGVALAENSLALVGSVIFGGKTIYEAAAEQGLDPGAAFEMLNIMTDTLFGVLEEHEELAV